MVRGISLQNSSQKIGTWHRLAKTTCLESSMWNNKLTTQQRKLLQTYFSCKTNGIWLVCCSVGNKVFQSFCRKVNGTCWFTSCCSFLTTQKRRWLKFMFLPPCCLTKVGWQFMRSENNCLALLFGMFV